MNFSVEQLEEILTAIHKNNIQNFHLVQGDFSLEITGGTTSPTPPSVEPTLYSLPTENPTPLDSITKQSLGTLVSSPIVGTFFESSAPDQAPYVTIGSKVTKGDVLFIIESMKLMNEVVAEQSGSITGIHVKNQDPVEYGQPILTIE